MITDDVPESKLVGTGITSARVDRTSDWSGNVYFVWTDGSGSHESRVPAALLRAVKVGSGRAAVRIKRRLFKTTALGKYARKHRMKHR